MGRNERKRIATVSSGALMRWRLLRPYLDRRQRTLWAAAEAVSVGHGGCILLAKITGISATTISARIQHIEKTKRAPVGSLARLQFSDRMGRKLVEVKDPEIVPALERMLTDETAGDPLGHQKWIRCTIRSLARRLSEQGHPVGHGAVARLLRRMGYSLHVMKKKQAGAEHPDRDEQFKYIAQLKAEFITNGLPIISVDTKKKELIGNYRREGKTWRKASLEADAYFPSYRQCVAVPFGIYDVGRNAGYVTVGISANTAEFAVSCLVSWWKSAGARRIPQGGSRTDLSGRRWWERL